MIVAVSHMNWHHELLAFFNKGSEWGGVMSPVLEVLYRMQRSLEWLLPWSLGLRFRVEVWGAGGAGWISEGWF